MLTTKTAVIAGVLLLALNTFVYLKSSKTIKEIVTRAFFGNQHEDICEQCVEENREQLAVYYYLAKNAVKKVALPAVALFLLLYSHSFWKAENIVKSPFELINVAFLIAEFIAVTQISNRIISATALTAASLNIESHICTPDKKRVPASRIPFSAYDENFKTAIFYVIAATLSLTALFTIFIIGLTAALNVGKYVFVLSAFIMILSHIDERGDA